MKYFLMSVVFLLSMSVCADTYYCSQTAKVFVESDNNVKKYDDFDDIYKLKIDTKANRAVFASLDQLSAFKNSLLFEFDILFEDNSSNQIVARIREKTLLSDTTIIFFPDVSSESRLVQTIANEIYTFIEYFKCAKENKY